MICREATELNVVESPNPYSTRFVKPGVLPFRYPRQLSQDLILERFRESNSVAEIAGPHGSGKSTLVNDLLPKLKNEFGSIDQVTIRSRSFFQVIVDRVNRSDSASSAAKKLIIFDGIERLSRTHRWILAKICRTRSVGLLATVHHPNTWLPTIATLDPQVSMFVDLARQLQSACPHPMDDSEFELAFTSAGKNCREAFMLLYDRHEVLRSTLVTYDRMLKDNRAL